MNEFRDRIGAPGVESFRSRRFWVALIGYVVGAIVGFVGVAVISPCSAGTRWTLSSGTWSGSVIGGLVVFNRMISEDAPVVAGVICGMIALPLIGIAVGAVSLSVLGIV